MIHPHVNIRGVTPSQLKLLEGSPYFEVLKASDDGKIQNQKRKGSKIEVLIASVILFIIAWKNNVFIMILNWESFIFHENASISYHESFTDNIENYISGTLLWLFIQTLIPPIGQFPFFIICIVLHELMYSYSYNGQAFDFLAPKGTNPHEAFHVSWVS